MSTRHRRLGPPISGAFLLTEDRRLRRAALGERRRARDLSCVADKLRSRAPAGQFIANPSLPHEIWIWIGFGAPLTRDPRIRVNREQLLHLLREHHEDLRTRFGVGSVALFGSYARDEARPGSDIDIIVEFEVRPTFASYMGLIEYLEEVCGTRVDVTTLEKLKPRVRPVVERELIRVA